MERLLAGPSDRHGRASTRPSCARLPGAIETYRAALALVAGDPAGTVGARRPCDRDGRARRRPHRGVGVRLAGARLVGRRRPGGRPPRLLRGRRSVWSAPGNISDVLGCSITLGDLRITQGRLGDALRTFEDALRLAAAHEVDGPLRGTADMVVGLSQIAFEHDDLARRGRAPGAGGRAGRARSGCPSSPTAGGWPGPGCGRPRVTSPARSRCSRRPSGSTSATSPRTCGRCRRSGPGCWCAQGRDRRGPRLGARAAPRAGRRPRLRPRVRARHPGPDPAAPARRRPRRPRRRVGLLDRLASPPRRVGAPAR